ncbi:MAG: hypothetical protein OEY23_17995 [Acidimicrobiia bacterium]|nr:hypothetical protein [Acidimicrobiia bacterium]
MAAEPGDTGAAPVSDPARAGRPGRVVLRYEDSWPELLGQLAVDHAAALVPSRARELALALCDPGSFVEIGVLARREARSYEAGEDGPEADGDGLRSEIDVPVDGLVAGWGTRGGRPVFVAADDAALGGPVRGGAAASKVTRVRDHATTKGGPIVQIHETARVPDGLYLGSEIARYGYGVDLAWEVAAVGAIPKVAVVAAPVASQAAIEASWAHAVVLAGDATIDLGGGPLGGVAALRAGLADAVCADAGDAVAMAGRLIDLLPTSRWDSPPPAPPADPAGTPRPGDAPHTVADAILDAGSGFSLLTGFATDTFTAVGRIAGAVVGIAAPALGELGAAAAVKVERLVRLCDTFRLPLVVVHGDVRLATGDVEAVGGGRRLLDALGAVTIPLIALDVSGVSPLAAPGPLGAAVALDLAWHNSGTERPAPADEMVEPAGSRAALEAALRSVTVARPAAWEVALGRSGAEPTLFTRAAD